MPLQRKKGTIHEKYIKKKNIWKKKIIRSQQKRRSEWAPVKIWTNVVFKWPGLLLPGLFIFTVGATHAEIRWLQSVALKHLDHKHLSSLCAQTLDDDNNSNNKDNNNKNMLEMTCGWRLFLISLRMPFFLPYVSSGCMTNFLGMTFVLRQANIYRLFPKLIFFRALLMNDSRDKL